MERNLRKEPVPVCEALLDTALEYPIECEILLPDYCPDIVRVLTCRAQSDVTDTAVHGSSLTVEGMTTVTLCYLGDVGGLRTTQVRQPFSKSFELSGEAISPIVFADARRGYLTCRASSRRRVDVRGAFLLSAAVYDARTGQAVTGASGDLCLKTEETTVSCLRSREVQRFSQREEVTLRTEESAPCEVLRADCCAVLQEWRAVSNGILIKAEAEVSLLLSFGEEGKLTTARYSLPISRVLEKKEPAAVCAASLRCAQIDCAPVEEEPQKLSVEMQLEAGLLSCGEMHVSAAQDAFSTAYETKSEPVCLRFARVETTFEKRLTAQAAVALPAGEREIADVFASVSQIACTCVDGEVTFSVRATLAALLTGGEAGAETVSESVPLTDTLAKTKAGRVFCRPRVCVLSAEGAKEGENLTLTAELLVTGEVIVFEEKTLLGDVFVDENSPRKKDAAVGLYIRYAQAGESVWEVAKRYGAPPQRIMEDNGLSEETLDEDAVLMIPGV